MVRSSFADVACQKGGGGFRPRRLVTTRSRWATTYSETCKAPSPKLRGKTSLQLIHVQPALRLISLRCEYMHVWVAQASVSFDAGALRPRPNPGIVGAARSKRGPWTTASPRPPRWQPRRRHVQFSGNLVAPERSLAYSSPLFGPNAERVCCANPNVPLPAPGPSIQVRARPNRCHIVHTMPMCTLSLLPALRRAPVARLPPPYTLLCRQWRRKSPRRPRPRHRRSRAR